MIPSTATTARSNHCSQFSRDRPISPMSRMSSGCLENSSHTVERTYDELKVVYVAPSVASVTNTKSAIE